MQAEKDSAVAALSFAVVQENLKHIQDSIMIAEHAKTIAANRAQNRERVIIVRQALPDSLKPIIDAIEVVHDATVALLESDIDSLQKSNARLVLRLGEAEATARDLNTFNKKLAKDLEKAYDKSKLSTIEKVGLIASHVGAFTLGAVIK